eukprot:COSAG01_NODE_3678_length_5803_cov_60.798738_1_plen_297_part_00
MSAPRHEYVCAGCKRQRLRPSPFPGAADVHSTTYRCLECRAPSPPGVRRCPLCGPVLGDGSVMDSRQCSQCTRACEDDVIGGDLLELARTSPACIMGAARLTRHARHLRSRGQLSGGGQHTALLERSRHMIREHMHVTDDEKITMMDDFECELQYDGRCCAACGVRDAELVYTELVLHTVDGGLEMELLSPRHQTSVTFAMPGWLRVNIKEVDRLGKIRAQVFLEHDKEPGAFVKVTISALQLRYITRLAVDGGDAVDVHLVEEALHVSACGGVGFSCALSLPVRCSSPTIVHVGR